ncbi:methyltransferase domain-containing protein [Aquimarina sp. SS2-1]|uniref:methyltransferase domain-containing protein n=1 Tax=Aquimarina besae TaxID=3342247 RepID=UPI00366D5B36
MNLDKHFWSNKYKSQQTGWDIGYASPSIVSYFDQLNNKNIKILIPGCGNAYEAISLFENGFQNIYILDFVEDTLERFKVKYPHFPENQIINKDFFYFDGQFDLIVEQTFFCALSPDLRTNYAFKMKSLLKPTGKLIGLFFSDTFEKTGPPFGGTKEEYVSLFSPLFKIKTLEKCYNSIPPRSGNELFFIFEAN